VESLEKPVGDKLLQAMAQAYPDPVDLTLLLMVIGDDMPALQSATADLVCKGLAQARNLVESGEERLGSPCITDKGMAVADGLAADADEAAALLDRLEAATLRELMDLRIGACALPAPQAKELRAAIFAMNDHALVDAGTVWAHRTVSDWRGLLGVMSSGDSNTVGQPTRSKNAGALQDLPERD
jgi:hypothetical protein